MFRFCPFQEVSEEAEYMNLEEKADESEGVSDFNPTDDILGEEDYHVYESVKLTSFLLEQIEKIRESEYSNFTLILKLLCY